MNIEFVAAVSWIAAIMLLYGLKLIGDKRRSGFFVAFGAEVLWIVWGAATGAWALVALSIAICWMYCRAIWLWRKI